MSGDISGAPTERPREHGAGNRDASLSADFEFDLTQIKDLDRGATLSEKAFLVNLEKLATFDRITEEKFKRDPNAFAVQAGNRHKTAFFNNWWKRTQAKAAVRIQSACREWLARHSMATQSSDGAASADRDVNDELAPRQSIDPEKASEFLANMGVTGDDDGGESNLPSGGSSVAGPESLAAAALNFSKLKNMTESRAFQRMKIAQELIATEKNYVMQLEHMCSIEDTLMNGKRSAVPPPGRIRGTTPEAETESPVSVPKVAPQECRIIFGNVKELLSFNKLFLSDLIDKVSVLYPSMAIGAPNTQPQLDRSASDGSIRSENPEVENEPKSATQAAKDEIRELLDLTTFVSAPKQASPARKLASSLGRVFLDFAAFFRSYSVYSTNYAGAQLMLDKMIKSRGALRNFLAYESRHQEGEMSLQNLLIAPVQRIPRYALLLDELLKNTPPSEDDEVQQRQHEELKEALEVVRRTATYINDRIHRGQALSKVLEVQEKFRRGACDLVRPGRLLVKQGGLKLMSPHGYLIPHEYFLFSDTLLQAVRQRVRGKTRYVDPEFFWVLGVEDDQELRNVDVPGGRDSLSRSEGSLLQRLLHQLMGNGGNDNQESTKDGDADQSEDPGQSALAVAGVLFEENKLSQEEYDLIKNRVLEAEQNRVSDDTIPCSFKVLVGSDAGKFFWLCAPNTVVKNEWAEQLRAVVPKHKMHWERHQAKLKAEETQTASGAKQQNSPSSADGQTARSGDGGDAADSTATKRKPSLDINTLTREKFEKGLLSESEYTHIVAVPRPKDATDETTGEYRSASELFDVIGAEYGSQGYLAMRNALRSKLGRKLVLEEKVELRHFLEQHFGDSAARTQDGHPISAPKSESAPAETAARSALPKAARRSVAAILHKKHQDGTISHEEYHEMMKLPMTPAAEAFSSQTGSSSAKSLRHAAESFDLQSASASQAASAPCLGAGGAGKPDAAARDADGVETGTAAGSDEAIDNHVGSLDESDPLFSDQEDDGGSDVEEHNKIDARLSGIATAVSARC